MPAAPTTVHLRARHEEAVVLARAHGVVERLPEARPAGTAVELRLGGEQGKVAAGTGEGAATMLVDERARARALRAVLAQDAELLGREQLPPLGLGVRHLEGLGRGLAAAASAGRDPTEAGR